MKENLFNTYNASLNRLPKVFYKVFNLAGFVVEALLIYVPSMRFSAPFPLFILVSTNSLQAKERLKNLELIA